MLYRTLFDEHRADSSKLDIAAVSITGSGNSSSGGMFIFEPLNARLWAELDVMYFRLIFFVDEFSVAARLNPVRRRTPPLFCSVVIPFIVCICTVLLIVNEMQTRQNFHLALCYP